MRPGTQHSASETPDFLKRLLPRAHAVSSLPLLVRADSGFDGAGIAARVIQHARRLTLRLGECCAAFAVLERHYQALLQFSD